MRPIWAKKSHKNNSVNRRTSNERLFSPHLGAYTSQKSEKSYNDSNIFVCEESIGINAPDIGQKITQKQFGRRRTSNERELYFLHIWGRMRAKKMNGSYNDSKICILKESIGINAPNIRFNTHSKYAVRFSGEIQKI
jgi:hypothetical protein